MTYRTPRYRLREFVLAGKTTYEVWEQQPLNSGWWQRSQWVKVKGFASYEAAEKFISSRGGGYYGSEHDYDEHGKPILYGW